MKCALLVPDGVGARNFLLGPFLQLASDAGQMDVLHTVSDDLLPIYSKGLDGKVMWQALDPHEDNRLTLLLHNALQYAQMYRVDTRSMRYKRTRPVKGSRRMVVADKVARVLGKLAASPRGTLLLDRLCCLVVGRLPEVEHYRKRFREMQPSVLFSSNHRPPVILAPVLAARSLGIPTATFIFSWDNLTSKGRIAAPFDHYLVWSELMRDELLRYYPEVSPERVHIVGTPQFDPYADERLIWPREEFFKRIGADPSRPLICYSGGDKGNCPEDPDHAGVLIELIRAGRINGNPQVILRPTPVDDGTRYHDVRLKYPEMIYAQPNWVHTRPGDWASATPIPDDIQFLVNLTYHADLNVNLASTMTLDFAIHDKPVVNVAFNVRNPPPHGMPLWDFMNLFDHYQPVIRLGAARFARSTEELAQHVNDYLDNPRLDREARRKFVDLEVSHRSGLASQRIVEVLEQIGRGCADDRR